VERRRLNDGLAEIRRRAGRQPRRCARQYRSPSWSDRRSVHRWHWRAALAM